jgi:hypothetical protein
MREQDYPYVQVESNEVQRISKERCFKCPICHKVFFVHIIGKWSYKLLNKHEKQRVFCSWSCLRKGDKIIHPDLYLINK